MDLVVEGRTLGIDGPRPIRLGIDGEYFVDPGSARADVTFADGLLLPAAIDIHVHFRDPGQPHKEDITTGSTSAAFGGVGLAVDMPNTDPGTTTVTRYDEKVALVERKAVVDVGLWAGIAPGFDAIRLTDQATGYKLYAGPTTGDLLVEDQARWKRAVELIAHTGRPMAVHAEDPRVLARARARETAPDEPASHLRTRPGEAEVEVLRELVTHALAHGARLHAAHVSDPRTAELVSSPAVSGPGTITSEVTPHHLLFDQRDVERLGAFGKVNPPVRDTEARDALWKALVAGKLQCVASDHAPHTREEKKAGGFDRAPSGLPGVETLYPLMLAAARAQRIPWHRVLDACCRQPARIIGVPAGKLAPGAWASFVHVPDAPRTIRADELHSRCGWSPFEGMEGLFPDALVVRGRWTLRDGELVAGPGDGAFVGGPGWA